MNLYLSLLALAVLAVRAQLNSTAAPNTATLRVPLISTASCGTSKGCWSQPLECYKDSPSDCQYISTWERVTDPCDGYRFELVADAAELESPFMGKYTSLAFSHDEFMGEDSVVECVVNPKTGKVTPYISFNDGTHNFRLNQASQVLLPQNFTGSFIDNRLSCSFVRCNDVVPLDNSEEQLMYFDLTKHEWQLQVVVGLANPIADQMIIHSLADGDLYPWVATHKVSLDEPSIVHSSKHYVNGIARSVQYKMAEAHAILYLIAWWILGSVGMLLGRYFKKMWLNKQLLGTDVWYQLHRNLFVGSIVLQVVGFVLVFVQAGDFKTCTRVCDHEDWALFMHAVLGTICTVIAILQPFLAWVRPGALSPYRPMFNWTHWFLGVSSWILATITIFYGYPLGKTGLERVHGRGPFGLMAAYIAGYVLVCVVMELVEFWTAKKGDRYKIKPEIPMGALDGPVSGKSRPKTNDVAAIVKTALLVIFALFATAIVGGLCYYIYMVHAAPH